MKSNVKKKSDASEDFVLMGHTRALLSEVWERWRNDLGQTPDVAKRMMTAAIKEFHTAETSTSAKKRAVKKSPKKSSLKRTAKKIAGKAVRKITGKRRTASKK